MDSNYYTFIGNLYCCPVGERLKDCPLNRYDNLSFEEKIWKFKKLAPVEKDALLEHHRKCAYSRTINKFL